MPPGGAQRCGGQHRTAWCGLGWPSRGGGSLGKRGIWGVKQLEMLGWFGGMFIYVDTDTCITIWTGGSQSYRCNYRFLIIEWSILKALVSCKCSQLISFEIGADLQRLLMAAQEVLLEEGAPINALDMNKQSALHAAVFLLMDDMVEASDSRLRHLPNGVFPAIKRSVCWMILSNLRRVVSNLVCSDPHETIANMQRDRNSRSLFAQKMLSYFL